MKKPALQATLKTKIIAGLTLAVLVGTGYAVQAAAGQKIVDTATTSPAGTAIFNKRWAAFTDRPDVAELFKQPMFDTRVWHDYTAKTVKAQNKANAADRVKTMKLIDSSVWLPGLNAHYKRVIDERKSHELPAVEYANRDAVLPFFASCAEHGKGLPDADVHKTVEKGAPAFTKDIVDYALTLCAPYTG